ATLAARAVRAVQGTGAGVRDTRKTTPGLRALEKAAVAAGGASNHRMGLHDAILIKDNHIAAAGGIAQAIARARAAAPALAPTLPMAPSRGPEAGLTRAQIEELQAEVRALAAQRDAVILAHNYQVPEVQDVADYVGDSLGLSRQAAAAPGETIVFCGVHFMAETASILCPDKTVLIPDLDAGCSLAASIDAEQLAGWKRR